MQEKVKFRIVFHGTQCPPTKLRHFEMKRLSGISMIRPGYQRWRLIPHINGNDDRPHAKSVYSVSVTNIGETVEYVEAKGHFGFRWQEISKQA